MRLCPLLLTMLLAVPVVAFSAASDNNIEWSGVSHVAWQDRRPLCPVNRETFQVRIQTHRNDVTAVRVRVDDGTAIWVGAAVIGTRGLYDIWAAQVPASAANVQRYYFEITDGTDVDYCSTAGMVETDPGSGGFTLDFTTLEHAPVGATPVSGGGAVFKVWAPTRTTAHVRGDFNGWGTGNPMVKVDEHFVAHVPTVVDRQMYKYFFNNVHWNTDARARSINASNNYNAHIEDPFRYAWTNPDFATPPLDRMVIYQLHVGTFAGRNDPLGAAPSPSGYVDVAARAGHLAELGVNAVLINPFTEFDGDFSGGYNPVSQWAAEWKYGTPDQLKSMVDAFHQNGIAVLLDIVWNHFSVDGNFMWNYDGSQTYFDTPHVDTPWGAQADFDRAAVRDYYVDSALYWLEEYKLDGFRMDATDYMNIGAQTASGWSLMQRFNDAIDNRWKNKVAIAEQLPDDAWVTRPTSAGGAGFDSQYYDAFVDQLRQETFDAAAGDPEMWRIRDIVNGGEPYLNGHSVLNYLELHDEAWPTSGGQRFAKSVDTTFPHDDVFARGRSKLAQGVVMFAPGVPAFLMGAEWLEDTDFGTGAANRIDWSKKTTYASIFQYFQDIIRLRRTYPALWADASRHVFHLNEGGNVIGFRRWDGLSNEFVILANFGNTDYPIYRFGAPVAGNWQEVVNSQAAIYGGSGPENPGALATQAVAYDGFAQSLVVALPRMGLLVFAPSGTVSVPVARQSAARARITSVAPSPARGPITVEFELASAGPARLTVHDLAGRRIATLADGPRATGVHSARWDGRDDSGATLSPGLYFVRLQVNGESIGRRVAIVR